MNTKEKIEKIEELLDIDEGIINEDSVLADLDEWDSITKLSMLIFFEEEMGKKISAEKIKEMKTVKDIMLLMD